MPKLKLVPDATFKATVKIPVAGGESSPVEFVFKHRSKADLEKFIDTLAERTDEESILAMAEGWDLEDKFNADSVALLTQNYIGAALEIYFSYRDELTKARTKN
jgi:hypothetical protein